MSSASSAAPGAAGAGAAAPPAAKPIKVVRKEGETAEERRARHAEKKRKVGEHRAEILRRLNAQTGRSRLHKQENFVCPVVFDNSLPPPPVDAKMLVVPLDDDAFISYDMINGVSSEQGFLHQLHADPGLGVPINLVETSQMFTLPPEQRPPMHELDAEITSERYARPAARKNDTMTAEPMVEWMMRGTHMHLDLYDAVYKHADSEKIQQLRLEHRRAAHAAGSKGTRRERIDASFKAVAPDQPVVHPTNKALQPRRVWEVLPAPQAWALNHVLVAFDSDPDPVAPGLAAAAAPAASAGAGGATTAAAAKRARLEGALIRTPAQMRPVNVAERTVRVDYLLPEDGQTTSSSASSPSASAGGAAARSLRGVRTYHMAVEPADRSKGDEQYVLLWDDSEGSVLFAPIRARAALTRVAGAAAGEGGDGTSSSSSSMAAGAGASAGAGIAPVSLRERPALPEEQDAALEASASLMDAATAAEWRAEAARRREARRQEGIAQADAARSGAGGSSTAAAAAAGAASQRGGNGAAPAAVLNGSATVSGVKRRAPDAAGEDDEAGFADDE